MNKAILLGRLARDPEMKATQTGKSVANFVIAVDRIGAKDGQPSADFIPCVSWEKQAEFVNNYLKKGSQVLVEGRITIRSYEAQDGSKRYVTEIVTTNIEFAGSKPKSDNAGFEKPAGGNFGGQQGGFSKPVQGGFTGGGFGDATNDDIPF